MGVTVSGPELPAQTCGKRLTAALADSGDSPTIQTDISWFGPARASFGERGTESTIQALTGLMEVHGWDAGRPRRLGLEMASVATGLMAANGALAAVIGAHRGSAVRAVETSVVQGGIWLIAHHIAAATAEGEMLPSPSGPEPGPPFLSADGRWFEIEVFDADGWKSFWERLGAGDADLGRAWTSFRSRYYRGLCSFPHGLHEAARHHTMDQADLVARDCGVSLCPVRSYAEVLANPGWAGPQLEAIGSVIDPAAMASHPVARTQPDLPLQGIRVVEATNRMQGPLAGLLLQMLGAEVIRVEPPGGDIGRMVQPSCGQVGSFFQCYNRHKRSIELDLTGPAGRSDLLGLLRDADVFLHNWRPGRAEAWGLDRSQTLAANQRLVYAAATGWGVPSANAHLIGTDFLVQAYAGFGDGLNAVGEPPMTSRVLLTDCMGALVTCEGILAGLYRTLRTGRGVSVNPSLLEGAMASQAHVLGAFGVGGDGRAAGRPMWGALDRPIGTEEGWLVVSADDPADYRRMCEICNVPAASGRSHATEAFLVDCFGTRPASHWQKLLAEANIPCTVVTRDLVSMANDERFAPLLEPLSANCRAPANPWVLTP